MKFSITLQHLKSTKGTEVFGITDPKETDHITQLYIKKGAFNGGKVPESIVVTVAAK